MTARSKTRYEVLLEVVFLFIVPVLLVYSHIVPFPYYPVVGAIFTIFTAYLVYRRGWTRTMLQIRLDNIGKTFVPHVVLTVIGIAGIIAIASVVPQHNYGWNIYILFFAWSLPIAAVQEFLYRGFLMRELSLVFPAQVAIGINTLIFTFLHIPFSNPTVILPMVGIAGFGFAWVYSKYPNLILITLCHAVLNFFVIWYGFFPPIWRVF